MRVAKEMLCQGHDIIVLTQSLDECVDFDMSKVVVVRSILNRSTLILRILTRLGRILGIALFDIDHFWIWKAKKEVKKLLKVFVPDFVYCRSSPIDPFPVGVYSKKRFNSKLLLHFTDPIPSISEYPRRTLYIKNLSKNVSSYIKYADKLSFGTKEMLEYEEKLLRQRLKDISFVSPDAVSNALLYNVDKPKGKPLTLVYLGSICKSRNPWPLFNALKKCYEHDGINLEIYSGNMLISSEYSSFIKFIGRTHDIHSALGQADILVDLDIDESYGRNVFISSKLKDYLLINRPILSIASPDSPTRRLLDGLKTVVVVDNNEYSIIRGINQIRSMVFIDEYYKERCEVIDIFSPKNIVSNIITQMK